MPANNLEYTQWIADTLGILTLKYGLPFKRASIDWRLHFDAGKTPEQATTDIFESGDFQTVPRNLKWKYEDLV